MKIGDYVIINHVDCPCTRLISKITKIEDNIVYADYVCDDTLMKECSGHLSSVTLVSDFGKEIVFLEDGYFQVKTVSASIARYRDDNPRFWQECQDKNGLSRPQKRRSMK